MIRYSSTFPSNFPVISSATVWGDTHLKSECSLLQISYGRRYSRLLSPEIEVWQKSGSEFGDDDLTNFRKSILIIIRCKDRSFPHCKNYKECMPRTCLQLGRLLAKLNFVFYKLSKNVREIKIEIAAARYNGWKTRKAFAPSCFEISSLGH